MAFRQRDPALSMLRRFSTRIERQIARRQRRAGKQPSSFGEEFDVD
jgi:hypothetical protein